MNILIKNGILLDMVNPKYDLDGVDVYIEGSRIAQIGKNLNLPADKIIDAKNKVVMPGLINCHNHSAMSIFRGYADDLNLMDWLNNKIWPIEEKMTDSDIYYSSMLSIIEMIKSGTTTFNDMYFGVENTIKAALESGIRAIIGYCVTDNGDTDEKLAEAKNLYENHKNSETLDVIIAPHAPYTCKKEVLSKCVDFAKSTNTPLHIHLSETLDENNIIQEKYGLTPTEYLQSSGLFDVPLILAHCVYLNDSDINILKNANCGIAHNPISNLKLASGIAPIVKYLDNNINVGLGTDGNASTNTLDMFQEIRTCGYMQKVNTLKSDIIDAYTLLKLATVGGSKVLQKSSDIGTIEVGKKADIIIIDLDKPHLQPVNNLYSTICYSAVGEDVATTIVNGKILMENRKLIGFDEEDIINKCNECIKRLNKNTHLGQV